ncbi:MAG: hypothetical protein AB9836_12615 [Aminipila sp.]
MFEEIKTHKFIFFMIRFIIVYLVICNIFANGYYHLKADQKVEKVIVRTPTQEEIVITSKEIIEKVNRQFHMQVFLTSGLGDLAKEREKSYRIIFYNGKDKEMKGFNYSLEDKKIYPGELTLPQNTELVMDELVHPANM